MMPLFIIGKTLGGSQVRTEVRETAREWWKMVHASGDPVKGGRAEPKGGKIRKDTSRYRVGKVRWKRSRHVDGHRGMCEI